MLQDGNKRAISIAVFSLAILGSLAGCAVYPGALFVVGVNDCTQEVLAITFACATPLPVCLLALWKRVLAGAWLIFAGAFFTYGMLAERSFMINVRHFNGEESILKTVVGSLAVSAPLIAVGLFGVLTGLAGWPSIWKKTESDSWLSYLSKERKADLRD